MTPRCPQCRISESTFEPVLLGNALVHRCTGCRFFIDELEATLRHSDVIANDFLVPISSASLLPPSSSPERRTTGTVGKFPRFEFPYADLNEGPRGFGECRTALNFVDDEDANAEVHATRFQTDAPTTTTIDALESAGQPRFSIARIAQPWLVALALLGTVVIVTRGPIANLAALSTTAPINATPLGGPVRSEPKTVPHLATVDVKGALAAQAPPVARDLRTAPLSPEGERAARIGSYARARVQR